MSAVHYSGFQSSYGTQNKTTPQHGAQETDQALPMVRSWSSTISSFSQDVTEQHDDILRSFDMVFQVHQRSEEIRNTLQRIDRVLLSSRTVVGLIERVIEIMENNMDLVAVRFLFRNDHPLGEAFAFEQPRGIGMLPLDTSTPESLLLSEPFVLDEPHGGLARTLFGDATHSVASAVVAPLRVGQDSLGLMGLGSDNPDRYYEGVPTDLIASMAEKIALGIQNAWEHESVDRRSLMGWTAGIYTETFFHEYLRKEFSRSWRSHAVFSLMALSWQEREGSPSSLDGDIMALVQSYTRSSDVLAEGETVKLWLLLPNTDTEGARSAAERLYTAIMEVFGDSLNVGIGISAFSREATVVSLLVNHARWALEEAWQGDKGSIVVRPVKLV